MEPSGFFSLDLLDLGHIDASICPPLFFIKWLKKITTIKKLS